MNDLIHRQTIKDVMMEEADEYCKDVSDLEYRKFLFVYVANLIDKINMLSPVIPAEPCGGCISRQAALECLDWKYPDKLPKTKIIELPSVTPQTKIGRWIPVSERLPEQPYGCIVTVEDEEPMTGQWFEIILPYHVGWDGERWNDSDGEQCPFEVIAWMPLPNVYRNGE